MKNNEETKQPASDGSVTQQSPVREQTATELLKQWNEAISHRSSKIDERNNNYMLPPIGIEEQANLIEGDISLIMWFLDETLKRLTELETKPS